MPITTTTEDNVGTPGHSINTFSDSEEIIKLIEINAEKERWTMQEIAYIVNGEFDYAN